MQALRDLLLSTSPSAILVVSLVKASLILAIAQVVVSTLPRLSASMRHFILTAALSSFIIVPAIAFIGPKWNVPVKMDAVTSGAAAVRAEAQTAQSDVVPVAGEARTATALPSTRSLRELTLLEIATGIWLLVSLLLIARLVRSAARVRGIVRTAAEPSPRTLELLEEVRWRLGIEDDVRVLESDRIAVPMAWGFRNGTLLLPTISAEWSDEDVRGTLIHELAHLQRLDYLSLTLMNVVSALLWFHPQIWTARGRALAEGERACDDLVVRAGELPSGYASHLLQVARLMPQRDPLTALLAMSRPSQLEGRMYAILSTSVNRQAVGRRLLMSALTSFFAAVIPLAMMQPVFATAIHGPAITLASTAADDNWQSSGPRHRSGLSVTTTESRGSSVVSCGDYNISFGEGEVARAEERIEVSGNRLTVTAHENGGISLRRSTTGAFSVLACKAAGATNLGAATALLARTSLSERAGVVSVDGPDDEQWVVHLIVGVPDGATIEASAQNGPLSLDGINATVFAQVQNGPLSLSDSQGAITARATNGPLSLTDMSGDVEASVQNGPLTVTLDDAWQGGELRASVQNGPLQVNVPDAYGSGVVVNTNGRGPFKCSLAECSSLRAPAYHHGPWSPREVRLGSGATNVFIEAGNGPITISEDH